MLVAAHGDRSLAGLRDFVFQHDEIDAVWIHVAEPKFAGDNRPDELRPISFRLYTQLPALFDPRTATFACKRNSADFEVNMVFVVHGNLEYNHVGPLDHRIDDLAVDKV